MKYDHLIQSMEEEAGEKIRAILERAETDGKGQWDLAREKAGHYRDQLLSDTKKQVEIEKTRQIYEVRENLHVILVKEQEIACEEVFSEAGKHMERVRTDPSYGKWFLALLSEVLDGMGDMEPVIHVDPRDEDLCRRLLKETGRQYAVISDITSSGGLNGMSPDGRVMVRNTFEDRLVRARDSMKPSVFSLLNRDPDVR